MKRLALVIATAAALLAAAWAGAWFYFRGEAAALLDAEEARLAALGGRVGYDRREIGGFPTAFRVDYAGLTLTLPDGTAAALPTVRGEVSVLGGGGMR
ncbi:MAG: DUF2125 domain-containing protein, partial [Alphaproteobacteria bacterium]